MSFCLHSRFRILLPVFTPKLAVSSCFQSWKKGNYTKLLAATHYLMFGYRLTLSRKQRLKFSKTLNYSFLTHLFTGIFLDQTVESYI